MSWAHAGAASEQAASSTHATRYTLHSVAAAQWPCGAGRMYLPEGGGRCGEEEEEEDDDDDDDDGGGGGCGGGGVRDDAAGDVD